MRLIAAAKLFKLFFVALCVTFVSAGKRDFHVAIWSVSIVGILGIGVG